MLYFDQIDEMASFEPLDNLKADSVDFFGDNYQKKHSTAGSALDGAVPSSPKMQELSATFPNNEIIDSKPSTPKPISVVKVENAKGTSAKPTPEEEELAKKAYQYKRKKNNDAVKRCRERKRREVMEREAVFTKLKNENQQLRWGMQKLSEEIVYLKEMLFNSQMQAGQVPALSHGNNHQDMSPHMPGEDQRFSSFQAAAPAPIEPSAGYHLQHPYNTTPQPQDAGVRLPAL
eukprot:Nk52_evm20s208 gene=Nk52_evmTU20s208